MEQETTGRSRWVSALYILAIATLLGVMASPSTRRVAREHTAFMLPVSQPPLEPVRRLVGSSAAFGVPSQLTSFAAAHPDDDALQVALAVATVHRPGESTFRPWVRNLARLLERYPRSATVRSAILRYTEGLSDATAGEWAVFDRAAAEGERLEPDNAFFPLSAAQGFDARGLEAESRSALLRAGKCSRWDDHIRDEAEGTWRLNEMGSSTPDGLNRTASAGAMLLPHYAKLRELAKHAMKGAFAADAAGRTEESLAIRHALMRIGSLMRSQATIGIGNMVGMALEAQAASTVPTDETAPEKLDARLSRYAAYLTSAGHPEEIAFARSEAAAGARVRAIFPQEMEWPGMRLMQDFLRTWVLALALLAGALFTLLSGFVTALLARRGWADTDRAICLPERVGTTLVAALIMLVPAFWMAARLTEPARWTQGIFNPITDIGTVLPWTVLALLAVPILLKLVLIVTALVRRRPLTQAVVRGFQHYAVPLAATMVLGYGGVLAALAHMDHKMAADITAQVQHEGRYYAHLQGKQWPE
ncbi:MAG TPA: hypothetical protein VGM51_19460 [Armatimonadota bacterium]